jgi:hypothetical protein
LDWGRYYQDFYKLTTKSHLAIGEVLNVFRGNGKIVNGTKRDAGPAILAWLQS